MRVKPRQLTILGSAHEKESIPLTECFPLTEYCAFRALTPTSKDYIQLVADDIGWASVPPGTRKSTYESPEYQKAAPFAQATLKAMETADPTNLTPLRQLTPIELLVVMV
jgi:hypothetical protein